MNSMIDNEKQSGSGAREKRQGHNVDDGTSDTKKRRVMCINLAAEEFINRSLEDIVNQCLRIKPIFVVADSRMETSATDEFCQNQHFSMNGFVRLNGQRVETTSPQVIAQITAGRFAMKGEVKNRDGVYHLRRGVHMQRRLNH